MDSNITPRRSSRRQSKPTLLSDYVVEFDAKKSKLINNETKTYSFKSKGKQKLINSTIESTFNTRKSSLNKIDSLLNRRKSNESLFNNLNSSTASIDLITDNDQYLNDNNKSIIDQNLINNNFKVIIENSELINSTIITDNESLNNKLPIKSSFKSSEKLNQKSNQKSSENLNESLIQKSIKKSTQKSSEKLNESSIQRLSKKSTRKTIQKSPEKLNESSIQRLSKRTIQKTTQKSAEKLNENERSIKKSSLPRKNKKICEKFICSNCKQTFIKKETAERHVIITHYGLARLNDDSQTEFTEREILTGYKEAIKILKELKCKTCSKSFTSALGLKCHDDICGKTDDELRRKCEICGNLLKFRSMKSHLDMHKREDERLEFIKLKTSKLIENEETEQLTINGRPIRKSAKKAKEFLKSNADGSDSDVERKRKKNKKIIEDDYVYEYLSQSSSDEEEGSNCSGYSEDSDFMKELNGLKNGLSMFNLNISSEKSFILFKLWQNHIALPAKLIEFINDSNDNIKCKLCNEIFMNSELLNFHYLKCNKELNSDWKCKLCEFKTESTLIILLKHFIDAHLNEIEEIPNDLIESMIPKLNSRQMILPFSILDTVKFYSENFKEKVFEEYEFNENLINFLNQIELQFYLPERKESAKFKFNNLNKFYRNEDAINNEWKTLNLFDSIRHEHHFTFYTGGPVYSASWCPYPLDNVDILDQILCVATNVKNRVFNVFDTNQYAGCLQFWNFGKLDFNFKSIKALDNKIEKPKLEFIIPHNYGMIQDLVWCPGGSTFKLNDNQSNKKNGRLGLLALACTDGYIRILNIPLIENLNELSNDELKIFKCKPIMILDKHPIGLSVSNKLTICKCLSWSITEKQRYLVAGYGNGLISIFDLKTNSSLLKKKNLTGQIELKPKKCWIGHGAIVNSVKWIPLNDVNYILSGSFDRMCRIWPLDDMVTNIGLMPKKSIITKVDWLPRYCGVYISSDDCYSNLHNNVQFRDCTLSSFTNSLSRHKACVWDFDISSWANVQAGVDSSGESVISVYIKPRNGKKYTKYRPYECLPLYRFTYESLNDDNIENNDLNRKENVKAQQNKSGLNINYLIDHSKPIRNTLEEMIDNYGLVFNDIDLSHYSSIPKKEFERLKTPETMNYPRLSDYPLSSINKVQWNPNKTSYNWIFTGTQSGLCRVSYVEFLKDLSFKIRR